MFLNAKVPYPYEVNWHLVTGNGSLTPISSLSKRSLLPSLTVQCNPDLVTSYLVTNPDLVTILQKTVFLVHKNILFSDNLVFSDPSI